MTDAEAQWSFSALIFEESFRIASIISELANPPIGLSVSLFNSFNDSVTRLAPQQLIKYASQSKSGTASKASIIVSPLGSLFSLLPCKVQLNHF